MSGQSFGDDAQSVTRVSHLLQLVLGDLNWEESVPGRPTLLPHRRRELRNEVREALSQDAVGGASREMLDSDGSWYEDWASADEWDIVVLESDTGASTFLMSVDAKHGETQVLYSLSYRLQDRLADFTSAPTPACPLHGHPLLPRVDQGSALWVCPANALAWRCRVGEYHLNASKPKG